MNVSDLGVKRSKFKFKVTVKLKYAGNSTLRAEAYNSEFLKNSEIWFLHVVSDSAAIYRIRPGLNEVGRNTERRTCDRTCV